MAARLLGYAAEELIGQPSHSTWHHTRIDGTPYPPEECPIYGSLHEGIHHIGEERFWRKDGSFFTAEFSSLPMLDDRKTVGAVVTFRDITERKRAEQERRAVESRYQTLFESAGDALMTLDGNGFLDCNTATLKMFGCAQKTEFISVHPGELSPPCQPGGLDSKTAAQQRIDEAFTKGMSRFEWVHRRNTGEDFPAEVLLTPFRMDDRPVLLATVRDLTEAKKAEQERTAMQMQLQQAQKLESIGRLAAGIAHEINTPTQYIGDNIRFLQGAFQDMTRLLKEHDQLMQAAKQGNLTPDLLTAVETAAEQADVDFLMGEIPSAITQSLEGVQSVTQIVLAMKEFSHPGKEVKSAINLNHAIESTTTVARNEWKYVADLQLDLEPSLPPVPCLAGEFNQVILNLVINAAHAIAEKLGDGSQGKGAISVSTRQDGDWVEVRVADSGNGIPEGVRDKIFTPFFTTKPLGKGTGQGLALARSVVVDKHGGTIRFESTEGAGTTFIIRLPFKG